MLDSYSDDICESLLATIDNLISSISTEESEDIFDIRTDIEASQKFGELKRLRRSLEEYNNRSSSLLYVGFVGHFSAGKSSSINSLLKSVGIKAGRQTGLNPTDKSVTLITDINNSNKLLGTHNRGDIEVGTAFKESSYLIDKVIVDTPGSGDPGIVEEVVRDFLPICDVIIYVLTAVSALDTTDIPVLKKARSKLPSIPIKFVVTRGDEFLINKKRDFTTDNINVEKKENFLAELAARFSNTIDGLTVSKDDIIVVCNDEDNYEAFGIDELKTYVDSMQEKIVLSNLHSHKVKYYIDSISHYKKYFLEKIESKRSSLDKLLETAKKNHEDYQRTITITNSKLTENWTKKRNEFNLYKAQHLKSQNYSWYNKNLPQDIVNNETYSKEQASLTKKIEDFVTEYIENVERQIKVNMTSQFNGEKQHFHRKIKEKFHDYPNIPENCNEIAEQSFLGNLSYRLKPAVPSTLHNWIMNSSKATYKYIENCLTELIIDAGSFHTKIKKKEALVKSSETHKESIEQLNKMFEDFIQLVRVYTSAVLSMNSRELAEKIGITKAIEKLESSDIEQLRLEALQTNLNEKLFPNHGINKQEFEDVLLNLDTSLTTIVGEYKASNTKFDSKYASAQIESIIFEHSSKIECSLQDVSESISSEYLIKHRELSQDIKIKINKSIDEYKLSSAQAEKELRKQKIRSVSLYGCVGSVIGSLIYFAYSYLLEQPMPESILGQIFVGLGVNILFASISVLISKSFNSSGEEKAKTIITNNTKLEDKILEILNSSNIRDWSFLTKHLGKLKAKLLNELKSISNKSSDEIFRHHIDEHYTRVKKLNSKLTQQSNRYRDAVETHLGSLTDYYSDIDGNLEKLKEFSEMIKEDSIYPSLNMFEQKSEAIKSKHDNIRDLAILG